MPPKPSRNLHQLDGRDPEKKVAGNTIFTSKTLHLSMSDHAGAHVDAPVHVDPRPGVASTGQVPLEEFCASAICLDLSHVPLRHAVTVPEMEAALAASGQEIRKGDTVLLRMAVEQRLLGKPGYLHDFPGLAPESVHWLADRGIGMFGVEAISPAPEGELNFKAHMICAERGTTHGMPGESGQAGGSRPLHLHRLPAQDPRRHRQPDPRCGDVPLNGPTTGGPHGPEI